LSFFYWIDYLSFITEGKLAAIFIKPSLGVSNWPVIYFINYTPTSFLAPSSPRHQQVFWRRCRGKRRLLQGEFRTHILYFVLSFALLYFYLHCFIKNTQKISFLYSCFYLLAFSLVRMGNPEVEVHTFKQQGGESFKDAWYRISNSYHRCTKKHSTKILLRNFYVGITSWYRYVLDTLAGGNFLGTPALEACTLIESLVGVPPIHVVKTEITL
jgi:hypothetical protein